MRNKTISKGRTTSIARIIDGRHENGPVQRDGGSGITSHGITNRSQDGLGAIKGALMHVSKRPDDTWRRAGSNSDGTIRSFRSPPHSKTKGTWARCAWLRYPVSRYQCQIFAKNETVSNVVGIDDEAASIQSNYPYIIALITHYSYITILMSVRDARGGIRAA